MRLAAEDRTTRAVFIMNNDSWVRCPINKSRLVPGNNELVVDVKKLNPAISVTPRLVAVEITGR